MFCNDLGPSSRQIHSDVHGKISPKKFLMEKMTDQTSSGVVGGLEHVLWLSIYWEFHHPNWLSYFSEGVETPNQYISWYIYIRLLIIFKQIRYPWYAKLPWYVLYISSKIKMARGPFFHGQIHVSPSSDQISICAMVKSWILCLFRRGINIPPLGWPQPLKYSHVTWLQAGAAKL